MFTPKLTLRSFGLALAGLAIVPTRTRAQQPSPEALARQKLAATDHQRQGPRRPVRRSSARFFRWRARTPDG